MRDVLTRGHIFINTSLTEAYCMAIVEAASCGLQVVSTRVGGIPEVLPSSLIILTEPNVESVFNGVLQAIDKVNVNRKLAELSLVPNGLLALANGSGKRKLLVGNEGTSNGITTRNIKKRKIRERELPLDTGVDDDIEKPSSQITCPFECNEIVGHLYNWKNVSIRTEKVYQRVMTEADPAFGEKLNCYLSACAPFLLVVSFSFLLLKLLDYIQPRKYIDVAPSYNSFEPKQSTGSGTKDLKNN